MADWSQLPEDLLQLIYERLLNSELYLLRFRSVCSTWRSFIPNHHPLPSPKPNANNFGSFYLIKRNIFLVKSTLTSTTPHHQQTLRPWLIKIGPDSNGQTRLWQPLSSIPLFPLQFPRVLDFNQLSAIDLGCEFVLSNFFMGKVKVVVASATSQAADPFVLFMYLDSLIFQWANLGWKRMPDMFDISSDICAFKGKPYVVDYTGRTVVIGLDLSLLLVAEPAVFGGNRKHLVESGSELLLVDVYFTPFGAAERFEVFRLEEKEKKWVKLTSLGDRVLFLGTDCSFSASASDLCVGEGNCVVFWDNDVISVYHLDSCRISPLSDCSDFSNLFWPHSECVKLH